jgi:hypothetical protein
LPNPAVRILFSAVLAAFVLPGAANATDQSSDGGKSAPAPTTSAGSRGNTTPAKFTPATRDVCKKHPNLKQCS